jgi:alpha-L-fucosidase
MVIGVALLLQGGARARADAPGHKVRVPIASGPFQPAWESLESGYQVPAWFRDAKFGIWAHWGPQCQPEQGDWYARKLYMPADAHYGYHLEHYGHPSVFGFKDIVHLWKAEEFDPEKLIALYKKAGAKYFVMLANHHDNFDNFNSKYQPWNSVAIGPQKDLVGMWEKAVRRAGMRFGVSVHAGRAWTWYEVAQGADKSGPKAGVPYDGKLTKADGKGQWWDGLDPQDLYAQNHEIGAKPDPAYCNKFFLRVKQLIDDYRLDLLYFDDWTLPLLDASDVYGLNIAAHFYNASIKWHGKNEAVMNTKRLTEQRRQALVLDIERGKADHIEPMAWQTDTCIGSWHYKRSTFENHKYKTAAMVVPMLVDIVSKNGNLLLSIPVRSNGTIDEDEMKFLDGMGAWIAVNGEAIYGTRPWKSFGEGPSTTQEEKGRFGGVRDTYDKGFTPQDIRFTTKGKTLYAIALAWPQDGKLVVKSLAGGILKPRSVSLLGNRGNLKWTQTAEGLVVTMPSNKPCDYAYTLKVGLP